MGVPVLIIGESGSGKTYSLKNFEPEEVGIFAVEKTLLPFRKQLKMVKNATYQSINSILFARDDKGNLKAPALKTYVIDDSQYLMANEFFDKAKDTGYQKYTDIGLNFRNLIHSINRFLPDDVIVYFLHHTELDNNTGKVKAKTVGKMIDNYLTVEGCFNIVLHAYVNGENHVFSTQSDGTDTAKSPEEMFEREIPNDLKAVDSTIREYYGFEKIKNNKKE